MIRILKIFKPTFFVLFTFVILILVQLHFTTCTGSGSFGFRGEMRNLKSHFEYGIIPVNIIIHHKQIKKFPSLSDDVLATMSKEEYEKLAETEDITNVEIQWGLLALNFGICYVLAALLSKLNKFIEIRRLPLININPKTEDLAPLPPKEKRKTPVITTVWRSIEVFFSPSKIPSIAVRCSWYYALFVGAFAITWSLFGLDWVFGLIICEPFSNWGQLIPSFCFFCIHFVFVFPGVIAILGGFYIIASIGASNMKLAVIRVILLTPVVLMLPSVIWGFNFMIVQMRNPAFSLSFEKPEWIYWHVFTVLGTAWWIVIAIIILIRLCFVNASRVRKL